MRLMEKLSLFLKSKRLQWKAPLTKSNSATHFCKVCFREMPSFRWVNLTGDLPICGHCFSEMKANEELFKLDGFEVRCLYEYTEKIRSLLYQLKGCNDIE